MQRPDITTINAREVAATRGPWSVQIGQATRIMRGPITIAEMDSETFEEEERNAAFIAAAREDVPALLDYIAQLEAQRRTFVHQVRELRTAQKGYFSSRTAAALQVAMAAERVVDTALDKLPPPRPPQASMEIDR